jgi:myo-inositol 2-dehydrogenase / D-chiro-inositol 1-dehydrogenase
MRVAVVGCGRMGKERAKAAKSFGVGTLLLYDEDRARADALASECSGAQCLDGPADLFREELDAVFVCIPPYCRGKFEIRAIDAGIPFFVEKPIGVTAAQARPILDRLTSHHVINAVGYMNRYRNSVLLAQKKVAGRRIIGIAAHWIGRKYAVPWWSVLEQSGGPFNEQATHLVDLFRFLTGSLEMLYVTATPPEEETTVLASVRLNGGGLGSFLYSCEAKEKDILIAIQTPEGVLELRGWDLELVRNTVDGSFPLTESQPIFEKETHAFLNAVKTGNRELILADFRDAYETQLAMDSAVGMMRPAQRRVVSVST